MSRILSKFRGSTQLQENLLPSPDQKRTSIGARSFSTRSNIAYRSFSRRSNTDIKKGFLQIYKRRIPFALIIVVSIIFVIVLIDGHEWVDPCTHFTNTTISNDIITSQGLYCWWVISVLIIILTYDMFDDSGIAFVFGMMLLIVGDVIDTNTAVKGYGNNILFTVVSLGIVSIAFHESTLLDYFEQWFLGNQIVSVRWALFKIVFATMFMSAFMHNATVVAMLVP